MITEVISSHISLRRIHSFLLCPDVRGLPTGCSDSATSSSSAAAAAAATSASTANTANAASTATTDRSAHGGAVPYAAQYASSESPLDRSRGGRGRVRSSERLSSLHPASASAGSPSASVRAPRYVYTGGGKHRYGYKIRRDAFSGGRLYSREGLVSVSVSVSDVF